MSPRDNFMTMDIWYGGPGTEDPEAVRWTASPKELLAASDRPIVAGPIKTTLHALARAGWVLRMTQRTPRHVIKTRPKVRITPPNNQDFGFRWKLRARPYFRSPWEVLEAIEQEPNVDRFSMTHFEMKRVNVPVADEALRKEIETFKYAISGWEFAHKGLMKEVESLKKERDSLLWGRDALAVSVDNKRFVSEELAARILDENADLRKKLDELAPAASESLEAILAEYREDPFRLLKEWTDRKVAAMDLSRPAPAHDHVDDSNVIDLVEHIQQRASVDMDTTLEERLSRAIGE